MGSFGTGTASSPIFVDDDSDIEVEAQVLPHSRSAVVHHAHRRAPAAMRPLSHTPERNEKTMVEATGGDTAGFQMLTHMDYEPEERVAPELDGLSKPIHPYENLFYDKMGLGDVSLMRNEDASSLAPMTEQGDVPVVLTKKQRKRAAQALRLSQKQTRGQAGPSSATLRRARTSGANRTTLAHTQGQQFYARTQNVASQDGRMPFFNSHLDFLPAQQAAMQMTQMAMGIPFVPAFFNPLPGLPMGPALFTAQQRETFDPDYDYAASHFASPDLHPQTSPPSFGLPDKPLFSSSAAIPAPKDGDFLVRGIQYRPALGPIGVEASPDTNYTARAEGVPGTLAFGVDFNNVVDRRRAIVLETIPRRMRSFDFLYRWLAQFEDSGAEGEAPAMFTRVQLHGTKALVEFADEAGAARAFASPRMNGEGGQAGIRAYAYVPPSAKPEDPPFVKHAVATPFWRNAAKLRAGSLSVVTRSMPPANSRLTEEPNKEKTEADARTGFQGQSVVSPVQGANAVQKDNTTSSRLVHAPPEPHLPFAHNVVDKKSLAAILQVASSSADMVPTETASPPASSAAGTGNTAYEAELRGRIKMRPLKRTRDEAFMPTDAPTNVVNSSHVVDPSSVVNSSPAANSSSVVDLSNAESINTGSVKPHAAFSTLPFPRATAANSTASASTSTSLTPLLTEALAISSEPSMASTTTQTITSNAAELDADAFLEATLSETKRQQVCPSEPRAAFTWHCSRRDALLKEFNAVTARQAAAGDRETKRALGMCMREIMAELESTRKAIHEAMATIDALKAPPTLPAGAAPCNAAATLAAISTTVTPTTVKNSPSPQAMSQETFADILPTLSQTCGAFPSMAIDSKFVFTWEDADDVMTVDAAASV